MKQRVEALPTPAEVFPVPKTRGYGRCVAKGSSCEVRHRANARVGSIVIRCVRFDELVAFWQAALGYVPREPPQDGWVVLTDPVRLDTSSRFIVVCY
jgi:hypothetical protein